jgi:GntR family transcriptional regulator
LATVSRGWSGSARSDGVPLAIERASLPESILPDPDAVGASLYAHLVRHGPASGPRGAAHFRHQPGPRAMPASGRPPERRVCGSSGRLSAERRVVEFTRSIYRGDAYDFAVELKLAPTRKGPPQ